jgi:SAM-dependent methyltransferase
MQQPRTLGIIVSSDSTDEPSIDPSAWVTRFVPLIRGGGTVLDLACGGGRHTRYLSALGYRVVAVDVDVSGVRDLTTAETVEIIEADLEAGDWPLGERRFDGIVVTNYLHRPHLPRLAEALAPGGVLIFETFAKGNEKYGRPRNPAFLLEPGELLEAFTPGLRVVAYEHGIEREPRPAVRQRICAVSSAEPVDI